ncbi:Pantothenate synthetase [Salinivirga cyanobacteriivorans]|uniref:Pantothenate synthetase n=1 Tax=Salinivirga cyanobacteriivorans TaxID=1307839 RepID=A0A0S2I100_9BACT|nr:pantoate--beta-alanine ligase [Salinivirga cyanobacteriivorans]ALO16001.1 Pantothenate synthetase [Salinivirga cyanobacteriivorans]
MQKHNKIDKLKAEVRSHKTDNKKIGFVPTMGALHEGHLSLINIAKKHADIIVVSVFVNPTQFNDPGDYEKYPQNMSKDMEMLKEVGTDIVFAPSEEEIYPEKDNRKFDFGALEKVMEGKHRPGHFNGVAQVVSRLFDIVEPDIAVFGEKDFQQLAIIRKMVKDHNYPVKIMGAPIIRENDGLAMSSRNQRLNSEQRKSAAFINQILAASKNKSQHLSVKQLEEWVTDSLNKIAHLEMEYFQIVDQETLQPANNWQENCDKIGCIAVYCGKVRLIDNIKYSF